MNNGNDDERCQLTVIPVTTINHHNMQCVPFVY
jgi:hypothetical protein